MCTNINMSDMCTNINMSDRLCLCLECVCLECVFGMCVCVCVCVCVFVFSVICWQLVSLLIVLCLVLFVDN